VTNEHVIKNSETVILVLNSGLRNEKVVNARLVRSEAELDLALLQVTGEKDLPALPSGRRTRGPSCPKSGHWAIPEISTGRQEGKASIAVRRRNPGDPEAARDRQRGEVCVPDVIGPPDRDYGVLCLYFDPSKKHRALC
jgi:hypothetical protein